MPKTSHWEWLLAEWGKDRARSIAYRRSAPPRGQHDIPHFQYLRRMKARRRA